VREESRSTVDENNPGSSGQSGNGYNTSGTPLNWAGQPYGNPYGPPQGHPYGNTYANPYAHPYGAPYAGPYGYAPVPPPRRRRRALPAVAAGTLAAVVAAGAILLHGGSTTLANPLDTFGSSASGTAAGATTPDYDTGVVNITAVLGQENAVAAGTGMILDGDGTILTNNHVVEGATSITATDVNSGKEYSASIVGTDRDDDIAVIQLRNASGLTPVTIGDSSSVTVGQKVVAIGNAGGKGGTPTVVTGAVTALDQTITATDASGGSAETLNGLIEVNAPIVAGDSGGPLTGTDGKVIGIDTAASASQAAQGGGRGFGSGGFGNGGFSGRSGSSSGSGTTSAGYAIPIASALTIAKQIEAGQSDSGSSGSSGSSAASNHGYLGVQVTDGTSGATVSGTVVGSPAEQAGLASGDVITSLDGHSVSSASALTSLLQDASVGQQVTLGWQDASGASHTATVTLMSGGA
jgi:S1-C subfamily serine protease